MNWYIYIYFDLENSRLIMSRFRIINHRLLFESRRWNDIDRMNIKCNLCNSKDLGYEFHYIFQCLYFSIKRHFQNTM